MFENIFYYLLLSISTSYMWGFADIFKSLKNKISNIPYIRRMLLCPECSSFWVGLFVSFFYNPLILDVKLPFLTNIFCGLITHFVFSILLKGVFIKFLYTKNEEKSINFL